MRDYLTLTAALLLANLAAAAIAADPAAWLPAEINTVARINVAEIYQTPLAKKEGWVKKATQSFIDQEAFVPPGTTQILIGSELDFSENLSSSRKFSVVVPEATMTLEKLSGWLPSGIERLSEKPLAQFGNDGYVVDAGDGCWLTTASTSRQSMSRWLRTGPTPGGAQLSHYLRSALRSKENAAQFLMAVDLQDSFSNDSIVAALKQSQWFASDVSVQSVAKVLESIKGMTIGIAVDQVRTGTVTVDFGQPAGVLKPVLEKLVAVLLNRVGATSDDFEHWVWNVKGEQVIGTGPVSSGGGRRLLSVLDPPSITHAISASAEATSEDPMARTSLKYCKSIRSLLDELQLTLKKTNDNHAVHFERCARKIDELPKLHVDTELLDYSMKVSSSLRYQAQSQRSHLMTAGTRTWGAYSSSSSYIGPYGWYATMPSAGTGATISAQENQAAKEVRFSEWKQIEEGLAAVRRKMTEKYQVEF